MARAGRTSFVGRAALLAELAALLDEVTTGAGAAALLSGEAGIGKTRTLQELALLAGDRGFRVAWSRCTELDGVPPFWAWREVFTAVDVPALPEGAGRAGALAALLDRIDALTARQQPLLICAEDLHWADADTRWLLRGLMDATAGRALAVVASWRTAEPGEQLAGLPPRVHRLPLHALQPGDSVALARQMADGALTDDALARAAEQSGGNPFFVRELVRMQLLGAPERVPEGVREVLARRLARLPSPVVETLTAAAALGSDAELSVLAHATGQEQARTAQLIHAAVEAGLVAPVGDRERVEFVHAVVREVLLEEAGPAHRAAVHEHVARALEMHRPDAEPALATHWAQALSSDAAAHAVRHGRLARDAARAAGALDQAVAFAALVAERTAEPEDVLLLGDARARAGDMASARTDLLRAATAARARGRPDLLARAALALAGGEGGFEVVVGDPLQRRLLDEAAREVSAGGLRARVRARQAVAGSLSAPLPERMALARAAVAEAEEADDPGALLHALTAYADMIGAPRHLGERRAVADRMLGLARAEDDVNGELLARRFRLVGLLEAGEFAAADAEIEAFDRLAHRTHEPGHQWYPPLWRGMRALMTGREADAEAAADQVDAIGARARSGNAAVLAWTLRLAARFGRPDDLAALRSSFEEYSREFPPDLPQILLTRAWIAAGLGDSAEAELSYRPLADVRFATVPEDAEYLGNLLACTEAALLLRDRSGAKVLHGLLAPFAGRWIVDGIGAACWGVVAEWLSHLAALLGRPEEAGRRRVQAEAAYRDAGATGPLRRLTGKRGPPTAGRGQLRREAGGWLVDWEGEHAALPELKGLHDLAMLVSRPGISVPAVRLLAAAAGVELAPAPGGDEVLDDRARAAYRDRLRVLEDEVAEAEAAADLGRAVRLRDEREFLLRELSAALGLGGRPRRLGDEADRARKAVTMRLRDAIARLDRALPGLAEHLRATVRTGRECCYAPVDPVSWRVSTRSGPG